MPYTDEQIDDLLKKAEALPSFKFLLPAMKYNHRVWCKQKNTPGIPAWSRHLADECRIEDEKLYKGIEMELEMRARYPRPPSPPPKTVISSVKQEEPPKTVEKGPRRSRRLAEKRARQNA